MSKNEKQFDAVAMMRSIRDRVSAIKFRLTGIPNREPGNWEPFQPGTVKGTVNWES